MTTFALTTSFMSLAIFAGFLWLSIRKFGWLGSYSAYASKWTDYFQIDGHTHIWSVVTIIVALLLSFGTIEAGDESPLQFLGFFAPIYLCVVAFTPKWETIRKQRILHFVGTALCAVCAILWIIFALHLWFYIPIGVFLAWCAAYFTKTIKTSYVLWLELAMFTATYGAVLIGG